MDPFTIILIITVIAMVAVLLLTPPPPSTKMTPAGMNDFTFPDASMGRYVPYLFGTTKLAGNLLWFGDLHTQRIMAG